MDNKIFNIFTDKSIEPYEYAQLMESVGWGSAEDYEMNKIKNSIELYSFIAHIRTSESLLIGYVSAFSDSAFSTFIGELAIHPLYQGIGLGKELIKLVEKEFKGTPIYAKPFESAKGFFIGQGYTQPKKPMIVVSKRNET